MNETYTRFIDASYMKRKQDSIQGIELSVGVELDRKVHWEDLIPSLKHAFLPPNNWKKRIVHGWNSRLTKPTSLTRLLRSEVTVWLGTALLTLSTPLLLANNRLYPSHKLGIGLLFSGCLLHRMLPVLCPHEIVHCTTDNTNTNTDTDTAHHLQPGDRLIRVENTSVACLSKAKVNEMLRVGESGDLVHVTVLRNTNKNDWKEHCCTLSRHYEHCSQVEHHLLPFATTSTKSVGYIAIKEFNDESYFHVQQALHSLQQQQQQPSQSQLGAVVLDLRGNPGGPVTPALDIACLFLPKHLPIMQMTGERSNGQQRDIYRSMNKKADQHTSILLLMDRDTASASEILIAALHGNSRAVTMGSCTVGKHVAQAIVSLSDGSGLSCTVREFFAPDGSSMAKGHTPDILVHHPIDLAAIRWNGTLHGWSLASSSSNSNTNPWLLQW